MTSNLVLVAPEWKGHRIIPSHYPPINLFERIYDSAEEWEEAYEIEALTNDRLLDQAGDLNLVAPEDRLTGPGASPVMAAFTHLGFGSRFTNGVFGVYYAADSLETAIAETICQWPLILTHFWPIELTHLLAANHRFSASNDSSHLPA